MKGRKKKRRLKRMEKGKRKLMKRERKEMVRRKGKKRLVKDRKMGKREIGRGIRRRDGR